MFGFTTAIVFAFTFSELLFKTDACPFDFFLLFMLDIYFITSTNTFLKAKYLYGALLTVLMYYIKHILLYSVIWPYFFFHISQDYTSLLSKMVHFNCKFYKLYLHIPELVARLHCWTQTLVVLLCASKWELNKTKKEQITIKDSHHFPSSTWFLLSAVLRLVPHFVLRCHFTQPQIKSITHLIDNCSFNSLLFGMLSSIGAVLLWNFETPSLAAQLSGCV